MTPSERERRIAELESENRALKVAWEADSEALQRAEAAARDFRDLLRRLSEWDMLHAGPPPVTGDAPYWQGEIAGVFARHPSFSGEEGTEG